jgi:hypothetical protein
MSRQPMSLESLQESVLELQRENRLYKRLGAAGLAVLALLIVMGQAPARKTVEANEIVVKDSAGNVRVRIGVDPSNNAAELWLQTPNGDKGASLSDSGLLLKQNGVVRTVVESGDLSLANSHGQANIKLSAADDAERDLFIEGSTGYLSYLPGHALEVSDSDGYETSIGSSEIRGATTADAHQTNAAAIVLTDPDKKVLWKAP